MEAVNIIIAIASFGGVGTLFFLMTHFLGKIGSKKFKPENIFNNKKNIIIESIKNNYNDSVKLETKINNIDNKLTENKKTEIKTIINNAEKEIETVLKTENISDIQKDIDIGWEDI